MTRPGSPWLAETVAVTLWYLVLVAMAMVLRAYDVGWPFVIGSVATGLAGLALAFKKASQR